jgi:UMF1 family MFS transporter
LIISSAIFPILYETQTSLKNEAGRTVYDTVSFLGREFHNTEFYAYVICLSYILVALMTPLLSGIADAGGKRKLFMQIFCYLGAISSGLLYFFHTPTIGIKGESPFVINWSMLPLFFGSIGFWASLVYYNAYLPDIAEAKDHDRVSARGFSMGYLGSSTLLIIILLMRTFMDTKEINWAFPMVSLWWIAFATFSFSRLPKTSATQKDSKNLIRKGYSEVYGVWKQIRQNKTLKGYLGSYFMFNMAVQTIMVMAVAFANKEVIGIKQQDLIISILIIQFIGIGGAYLMSFISKKIGNFKALGGAIVIWIALCIYVYQFVWYPWQFFIAAAGVGLVMGGIQSLSRSTYSKLLPETKDLTSYFSFYDLAEKLGLALGTLTFGLIEGFLDIRTSILALVVFFAFGLILLIRIPKPEQQAHETSH